MVWAGHLGGESESYRDVRGKGKVTLICDESTGEGILSLVSPAHCGYAYFALYRLAREASEPADVEFVAQTWSTCWGANPEPCPLPSSDIDRAKAAQESWPKPFVNERVIARECAFDGLTPALEKRRLLLNPRFCEENCRAASRPVLFYDMDDHRFGELQREPWKRMANTTLPDGRTLALSSYTQGDMALRLDYGGPRASNSAEPLWFGYHSTAEKTWFDVVPEVGPNLSVVVVAWVRTSSVPNYDTAIELYIVDRANPNVSVVPTMDEQGRLEDPERLLDPLHCPSGMRIADCPDYTSKMAARANEIRARAPAPIVSIVAANGSMDLLMAASGRSDFVRLNFTSLHRDRKVFERPFTVECKISSRECVITFVAE